MMNIVKERAAGVVDAGNHVARCPAAVSYTHLVQSKNLGKDIGAGFKTLVGGELKGYTEMLQEARQIATLRMGEEAEKLGADAVINVKFSSAAIMQGAAEVIVYGTAVKFK